VNQDEGKGLAGARQAKYFRCMVLLKWLLIALLSLFIIFISVVVANALFPHNRNLILLTALLLFASLAALVILAEHGIYYIRLQKRSEFREWHDLH